MNNLKQERSDMESSVYTFRRDRDVQTTANRIDTPSQSDEGDRHGHGTVYLLYGDE